MSVVEHTIELDSSPVFYLSADPPPATIPAPSANPGRATNLYLHGIPTSSDDWIPFLEETGGIAPDLLGFGRSGKGGHLDYSLEGHAEFLERLLAHLQIDRIALVLHDWGAAVGLLFAQRHPDRIEKLVLFNGVPLLSGYRWHRLARIWRAPLAGELAMGSTTRGLLRRTLRRLGPLPNERIDAIWQQWDQGTQRAILRLHRSADEQHLAAAGAQLHRVKADALVLWGERDPWLPSELANAYASVLPNVTVELVNNAGHWPWLEQPHLIDRTAQFLAR